MEKEEKIRIIKESYATLRARGVVKTQEDFANLLSVSAKSLSAAKNGVDGYCTDSLAYKILALMKEQDRSVSVTNSPNTNVITGDNNQIGSPENTAPIEYQQKLVPTIPIKAYRAFNFDVMEYFRTTNEYIHLSPAIAQFPQMDCFYFVNSDDMSPNLQTNDLLCLSRLPSLEHITNGDLCILNTRQNGILERFVYNDGDAVVLKSTQPRWTDMRIEKKDIFSVFRILGGIRTNI